MTSRPFGFDVHDEAAFTALACAVAKAWKAASPGTLVVGLSGELGAGKTTWVRGMLAGLGYRGRVPSPTYTLLEHYSSEGIDIVHVDLYRLGGRGHAAADADAEIESLGLREWLATDHCWLLVEWPERAPAFARRLDVRIELAATETGGRHIEITLCSIAAERLEAGLRSLSELASS